MATEREERRLAAILIGDMVGYSRLMEADESGTIARQKVHRDELIEGKITEYNGRIVRTTGDGLLVEFASAVDAVRCAVEFQQQMTEREAEVPEDRRIAYRIGINLGDIVIDGDDILGDGVNVAARLESIAGPGGIVVSDTVFEQLGREYRSQFIDGGKRHLKNRVKPVRVWTWSAETISQTVGIGRLRPHTELPSIAVLPFDNMSAAPGQETFADAVTDDIISELSQVRWLFVISRISTFTYKSKLSDVRKVANELGVDYVLTGSVQRSPDRVRINVQLVDGRSGRQVWAERFEGDVEDLFKFQDEIAREIVATVSFQVILSDGYKAERTYAGDLGTWERIAKATQLIYTVQPDELREARELLTETLEQSPHDVDALGTLSACYLLEAIMGYASDRADWLSRAAKIAHEAIDLKQRSHISHWVLGNVYINVGQPAKAVFELERALEINPNDSLSMGSLGEALALIGRSEEAIYHILGSLRANPRDPAIFFRYTGMAQAQFAAGNYEEAIRWGERAVGLRPDWRAAQATLAASYAQLGRLGEARETLAAYLEIAPHSTGAKLAKRLWFVDKSMRDRLIEGLIKAGLPEK